MAVITEINGVSTAGTTGVNNIFGSGTGGASSPTPAPGSMILSSDSTNGESFGANGAFLNVSAYTYPQFEVEVLQSNGTNIVPTPEEYTVDFNSGFVLIEWGDTTAYVGTYTVNIKVVDMGASPAEIPSSVVTSTYNRVAPSFKYYRLQGTSGAGTQSALHIAVGDIQLFEGPNATGTQHTGSNSGTYLSGYTGNDFTASAGFEFSSYYGWKPFDNSTGIGGAWWSLTLSGSNPQNNWVQLEFQTTAENSNSQYATTADFPSVGSIRVRCETNGSATNYKIMGSNTGAFAGEEHVYGGVQQVNGGQYTTINA